jgi:hypothetical protein
MLRNPAPEVGDRLDRVDPESLNILEVGERSERIAPAQNGE